MLRVGHSGLRGLAATVEDVPSGVRGAGTPRDPHIFPIVRDHRGLRGEDLADWTAAKQRLEAYAREELSCASRPYAPCGVIGAGAKLAQFRAGAIPFVTFRNLIDGRLWGRFFDPATNTVTTQPAPEGKSVLDYARDLGDAIVAGLEWLVEKAAALCQRLRNATDSSTERAAAEALTKAVGLPPGSVEGARRICQYVVAANVLVQGAPPPPPVSSSVPRYSLGPLTTQAAPAREVYPSGAVALRSPRSGGYVILIVKG